MTDGEIAAAAEAWRQANLDKGAHCPWCGQFAKIYRRKLNRGMALALRCMYEMYKGASGHIMHPNGWVQRSWGGDPAKLVFWDLIEAAAAPQKRQRRYKGPFRVTKRGCDFVEGRITVPSHVRVYNDELIEFDGDPTTWEDAYGSPFRLEDLVKDSGL
jgi:hypothetical protein